MNAVYAKIITITFYYSCYKRLYNLSNVTIKSGT